MARKSLANKSAGLPEQFLRRLTGIAGQSAYQAVGRTFVERPTTFRVNTLRSARQEAAQALGDAGFRIREIPWYQGAFVLLNKTKRELTETPLYGQGKIYIQSLASMAPPLVLGPRAGEKVLDLTAAPGSKTSQIAALMDRQGELVANDNNKVRFFKLKHNMELLGVAENAAGWRFTLRMEPGAGLCREYPEYFDRILLDAPCSAEARFIEGDARTYGYWSERKIKEMAYKQRQLLFSAWGALKPGGTLVYSTCTFAPEENELQIARLAERFPAGSPAGGARLSPVDLPGLKRLPPVAAWKGREMLPEIKKTFRIMPTNEIEGFFVACLKKI